MRKSFMKLLRFEPLEARQYLSASSSAGDELQLALASAHETTVDIQTSIHSVDVSDSLTGAVSIQGSVAGTATVAHDHDDEMRVLTEVVPREQATTIAIRSGAWSNASTWSNGVPDADAKVLIPQGTTVTYGLNSDAELHWVRVEGTLKFERDVDTKLRVETVVVDTDGYLEIGTQENPIVRSAVIEFVDRGAIEDWTQMGRGLITIGGFSIWGQETTSFVSAVKSPRAGDSSVELSEVPANWEVGGTVILPGVKPPADLNAKEAIKSDPDPIFRDQHELRKIVAIEGNLITFDKPVAYDFHWQLGGGRTIPIGFLTRNVTIRSENAADPSRRGHIMVLPGNNLDRSIGYAALENLGRTRADIHVTDPRLDENGVPIPETLANIRGRYSLHIHKNGPDAAILVKGLAINGGLKWGVASHSSNVTVEDSISFNVDGAHFVTESGVEIGAFRNNLTIYSMGAGLAGITDRQEGFSGIDLSVARNKELQAFLAPAGTDFGMWGYGFWLQGPLVEVSNNQAYGAQREAFSFTTTPVGTDWQGLPSAIPLESLPEELRELLRRDSNGRLRTRVPVDEVPFLAVDNVAIGSGAGLGAYFTTSGERPGLGSTIRGGFVGNVGAGINLYPPNVGIVLDDIEIENHGALIGTKLAAKGVNFYNGVSSVTFNDLRIKNFQQGIIIPHNGVSLVTGTQTKLVNQYNIVVDDDASPGQLVSIELAESNFGQLDPAIVRRVSSRYALSDDLPQYNIKLTIDFVRPSELFKLCNRQVIWLRPGQQAVRIYFSESARDYQLDSTPKIASALSTMLPAELLGKTSLDLWNSQHIAILGLLAPADAVHVNGVFGIVAPI